MTNQTKGAGNDLPPRVRTTTSEATPSTDDMTDPHGNILRDWLVLPLVALASAVLAYYLWNVAFGVSIGFFGLDSCGDISAPLWLAVGCVGGSSLDKKDLPAAIKSPISAAIVMIPATVLWALLNLC